MAGNARADRNSSQDWRLRERLALMRPYLFAVIVRRYPFSLQCAESADDLSQETLARAWAEAPHFHGHSDAELRAWLRGILHRVVAAVFRHHHQSMSLSHDFPVGTPGPDEQAAWRDELAHFSAALDRLTLDDLFLVHSKWFHIPVSETAQLLCISESTAQRHRSLALQRLADDLTGGGNEGGPRTCWASS